MTLEEMRQSKANLEYIVTRELPELIVLDDIKNLIEYVDRVENELDLDYVDRNFIPKEKVEQKIDEIEKAYEDSKDKNGESQYYYPDYAIAKLEELLGE